MNSDINANCIDIKLCAKTKLLHCILYPNQHDF